MQRERLGRINPRDRQPGRAEDGRVEEDEEDGGAADVGLGRARGVLCRVGQAAGDE